MSKLQQYKQELAELMDTKNDPNTPSDIKNAISPAIEKLNKLIADSKDSGQPTVEVKRTKSKPKTSSLEKCKEIIAKYRDKKEANSKRIEKRKKQGKPAELTPAETINKAAKSVKSKVVQMDSSLKISEEAAIISGIMNSVVSALHGIKDAHRKKMFISKIIDGLKKLDRGVGLKTAEHGGYIAKGGEVKVGDILTATTGVKVKVVEYDPKFGGRVRVERLDEYATGKPSQFISLNRFKFEDGGELWNEDAENGSQNVPIQNRAKYPSLSKNKPFVID